MRATNGNVAWRGRGRWRPGVSMGDASGQSLVELALIIPVFTLLILGAAEFGQVAYAAIEVSNAAHAGAAYGAQSAAFAGDLSGMQMAAIHDAPDVQGVVATASAFCSCANAASTQVGCGSASATCSASGSRALNYVQVNTTATVTPLVHYPGISGGFTLTGQAIMRVE